MLIAFYIKHFSTLAYCKCNYNFPCILDWIQEKQNVFVLGTYFCTLSECTSNSTWCVNQKMESKYIIYKIVTLSFLSSSSCERYYTPHRQYDLIFFKKIVGMTQGSMSKYCEVVRQWISPFICKS